MEAQQAPAYKAAALDTVHQKALRIIKGTATFEDRYNPDHEELVKLINVLRSSGCIIVFTTGVWDLFHIGHAEYIQRGKEEAAKLYPKAEHVITIVGIDSDLLTKARKGEDRPIVPEEERVRVLSHLRAVDILTLQTTSDQLFRVVEHDVRVTSTSTADLPGLEKIQSRCQHVVNLPPQSETSTTARIRKLTLDGGLTIVRIVETSLDELLRKVRDAIGTEN